MARYYISADLEGVCGVTSPLQCSAGKDTQGYGTAVRQLALEINHVAEALFESDNQAEILVNDAHNSMINLPLETLLPRIRLLSGKPKPCAMVAGLDASFDAALFIGYHAMAGTEKGVLNHTYHGKLFDVRVNGVSYGEGGINALYASLVHQVPVILASGDAAFCREIRQLIPEIETVETKIGLAANAAQCRSGGDVLEAYRRQIEELTRKPGQWRRNLPFLEGPYTLRITFTDTLACDTVAISSLYRRCDGRTVEMTANHFEELYRGLQSAYTMLSYTHYLE